MDQMRGGIGAKQYIENGAVVGEQQKRDNINVSHPSPNTPFTKALRPGILRRPGVR